MYKEDLIRLISGLLGDKKVISSLSWNISRDEHGVLATQDSYTNYLGEYSLKELNNMYTELISQ